MKTLKRILFVVAFVVAGSGLMFVWGWATPGLWDNKVTPEYNQGAVAKRSLGKIGSTTPEVDATFTHSFDAPYTVQGVCLRIKDIDGNGYTYLTTNNGQASFSPVSCE